MNAAAACLVAVVLLVEAAAVARPKNKRERDAGLPAPAASSAALPSPSAAASSVTPNAAVAEPEPRAYSTCTEHIPSGATRPLLKEFFPAHATSGYVAPLEVTIEHGKGETVLPQGYKPQSGSAEAREMAEAGFLFPEVDGGAAPLVTTAPSQNGTTTKVTIPVLLLPKLPGRNRMTLPPVPIAVARASGELLTMCTRPHDVLVEDPTAQTPEAKPRANPPPRQQLEEWTAAKQVTYGVLGGALLAALLGLLFAWWQRRPRPVPPPPPPRPPWEVAFEELFAVRYAGLAKEARYSEHYDRVSDAVRKYLGGRYGFDGLETTTREMSSILKRVEPPVVDLEAILGFLDECDLVKFARFTPSDEDCARILDQGEHIVRVTIPPTVAAPAAPPRPQQTVGGAS